ncbi:P-loop containing nucleoside triphosphate hydrolase protein [Mollisia scopiformis]|uniref:p-loop containing nucleoside triphosphate hydrolase protein n=1 Tax=Mollisia scopiformis TaxID=149040 RepID=A0A132BDA4_MOLSC|nr:P-loop containing nucleoside triphosphate hydrolase protein [Mollisia scopiformis]KUJ09824.1 P-loop containing nucleoside triphosphate hydrolase protein [Mollisia scopiformis]
MDLLLVSFACLPALKHYLSRLRLRRQISTGSGSNDIGAENGLHLELNTTHQSSDPPMPQYLPENISADQDITLGGLGDFIAAVIEFNSTRDLGFSIGFDSLSFAIGKKSKMLLSSVTGIIGSGTLCGILGPSGAGKTTFMKLLMGKLEPTTGSVNINGNVTKLVEYRKLIGFVPSDDDLLPELTVRESILHSARIRLPRKWSDTACICRTQSSSGTRSTSAPAHVPRWRPTTVPGESACEDWFTHLIPTTDYSGRT